MLKNRLDAGGGMDKQKYQVSPQHLSSWYSRLNSDPSIKKPTKQKNTYRMSHTVMGDETSTIKYEEESRIRPD